MTLGIIRDLGGIKERLEERKKKCTRCRCGLKEFVVWCYIWSRLGVYAAEEPLCSSQHQKSRSPNFRISRRRAYVGWAHHSPSSLEHLNNWRGSKVWANSKLLIDLHKRHYAGKYKLTSYSMRIISDWQIIDTIFFLAFLQADLLGGDVVKCK